MVRSAVDEGTQLISERSDILEYLKADNRNPYMGLDNKICDDPVYWCRLHQVWLSEEDVQRKHCKNKLTFDMISVKRCNCLEDRKE